MFRIFASDESAELTTIMSDACLTGPEKDAVSIVRNDQTQKGAYRESDIYYRARQIYHRGRRSSVRRGAGII